MGSLFSILLILTPIAIFFILLYVRHLPKPYALCITFLCAAIIAMFVKHITAIQIFAILVQGIWKGGIVAIAMFGSLLFFRILLKINVLSSMCKGFVEITPDRRIQMIIVAWFVGSGLENILGFGMTGGITSFILMRIGFPPACAATAAVMGTSVASSFSMSGLSILYGLPAGLNQSEIFQQLQQTGIGMENYLHSVIVQTAILNSIIGTFIPLFMIMIMTRFFGRRKLWTSGILIAPLAVFCGLALTIPYLLTAICASPEFAPLVGAAVGLLATILAIQFRFLIPQYNTWDFKNQEEWDVNWSAVEVPKDPSPLPAWMAWMPISILIILTLGSRFSPFSTFLQSYVFSWKHIFGSDIDIIDQPLFQSRSGALFATSVLLIILFRVYIKKIIDAFIETGPFTYAALTEWLLLMPIVDIYVYSGTNSVESSSMIQMITKGFAYLPAEKEIGIFLAPFLGVIGTFFTPVNTLSNMVLADTQYHIAQNLALPTSLFLALQCAGAAAGNMISLPYLAMSNLTVGMLGWESHLMRRTIFPVLWYVTALGILGILAVNFFDFKNLFY